MAIIESPEQLIVSLKQLSQSQPSEVLKGQDERSGRENRLVALLDLIETKTDLSACLKYGKLILGQLRHAENMTDNFQSKDILTLSRSHRVASLLLPKHATIRMAFEFLLEAIASGSSLIVKFSKSNLEIAEDFASLLSQIKDVSSFCQVVCSSDDMLKQILVSHPAISKVIFIGRKANFVTLKDNPMFLEKKWMASFGGVTTSLVLDSAELGGFSDQLLLQVNQKDLEVGPWTCHRVYVVESHRDKLIDELKSRIQKFVHTDKGIVSPGEVMETREFLETIKSEEGRIEFDGNSSKAESGANVGISLVTDLPNCSQFHQEEWHLPVIIINSVKYAYELAKWVNNDRSAYGVQIFGAQEKIESLLAKIQTGNVIGNSWVGKVSPMPIATGGNQFGFNNRNWSGSFWLS